MANFLEEVFIRQKLNNKIGFFLAFGLAAVIGFLLATHFVMGVLLVIGLLGICALLICIRHPEAALFGIIIYMFFIGFFVRWLSLDFPVSIVYDAFLFAGCLGVMISRKSTGRSDGYFFRSPVVILFLIFLGYTIIEGAAPTVRNVSFWFGASRKELEQFLLLFLSFNALTSIRKIKNFIGVLLVVIIIVGLYSVFQQRHGLLSFETAWVVSDSNRFGLYFIQGNFRKFSTLSNPTTLGVDLSCCALLFALIALYQKPFPKWALLFGAIAAFWGMIYTGTRTANVVILAGLGLFVMLGFNKRQVRLFTLFAALAFLFALYVPIYSSQPLNRFRSSFVGTKDASFMLRELDRAFIQHYIYGHPVGWGLGSINGVEGSMVGGNPLAGFQADDEYLRLALETGWIGLILFCCLNFVILRTGIRGYFRCENPTRKVLYAAAMACLFGFILSELTQEILGQLECDIIIMPVLGLVLRLDHMDRDEAARRLSAPPEEVL